MKLVNSDKCKESLTAKSLKYSRKCGNGNRIVKQPSQTIDETITDISHPEIIRTEQNPRIQRIQRLKEKQEKISRSIVNAFEKLISIYMTSALRETN